MYFVGKHRNMTAEEYFSSGVKLSDTEDFPGAISFFLKASELKPYWERPYGAIGACYKDLRQYNEAISWYKKAIARNSEWKNPYFGIGLCHNQLHNPAEAIEWFKKVIVLDPNWAQPYDGIGFALKQMQRFQEAINYFNIAIRLDAEYLFPYVGAGECYSILGDEASTAGQNEVANKDFLLAKDCFYRCINIDPSFPGPYYPLSKIPFQYFNKKEVYGQPWMNRYLLFKEYNFILLNFQIILDDCLVFDSPLLPFNLLPAIKNSTYNYLSQNPVFEHVIKITEPYREQFSLWSLKKESATQITEALMHFYMGNPIRTYEIFDNEIENLNGTKLSLMSHYYYVLSAFEIMEQDDGIVKNALTQAENVINNYQEVNFEDTYYAALILELGGFRIRAKEILHQLASAGFLPAQYKSADLRLRLNSDNLKSEIIKEFTNRKHIEENYFTDPEIIILNGDDDRALESIMPLIHFMECKELLNLVQINYDSKRLNASESDLHKDYYFTNQIIFRHLEEDKYQNYLKSNYRREHQAVYGNDEQLGLLQPQIRYFKEALDLGKNPMVLIGLSLSKSAFYDYQYIKNEYDSPAEKTDFKYYLILTANLQREEIITKEEASMLLAYIDYCAKKIHEANPDSKLFQIITNEIKGYIQISSILGVGISLGYGTVESLINIVSTKILGNPSPLISFEKYCELINKKNLVG